MRINREHPLLQSINRFLYSPAYFLYLGVLIVLSNVFGTEFFSYTMVLITATYITLFARDLLPMMPMFVLCYVSPSMENNPGQNEASIFTFAGGGMYLLVFLMVVAACLVYRLITDPDFGGKRFLTKKRSLLSGMLILGAAYAISGLGSGQWAQYGWRNLLFAFLQLASIAGIYYLFSGAVRWELAPKAYLFWTGMCLGYVLLAELAGIYIKQDVIVNGEIQRIRIITGWGHYNNIGNMFAMAIPLTFFLTGKGKFAWFAYISAFLFCMGLVLTCSRGSILIGVPIYVAAYVLSLVHSRHARSMKGMHIFHAAIILAPVLALIIFDDELLQMFQTLGNLTGDPSFKERLNTYAEGFRQFRQFPLFGGSFFPLKEDLYTWATSSSFTYLFPPRWHNTLIQLLASGGIVCLLAYLFHRYQTVKLFAKNGTSEKLFVALSIGAMLLTSMVDCHFFNLGPALLYSAMLAVVEFRLNKPAES